MKQQITGITFTNHPVYTLDIPEDSIKHQIVGNWVCIIPPNHHGYVLLDYLATKPVYDIAVKTIERETKTHQFEFGLSEEQLADWELTGYDPIVVLVMIAGITYTPGYDQWVSDPNNFSSGLLLERLNPELCGCGMPDLALKTILNTMMAFNYFPGSTGRHSVYDDGGDLTIAYILDAVGGLLEHGSSVGGSWLTVGGVAYALLIMAWLENDDSHELAILTDRFVEFTPEQHQMIAEAVKVLAASSRRSPDNRKIVDDLKQALSVQTDVGIKHLMRLEHHRINEFMDVLK